MNLNLLKKIKPEYLFTASIIVIPSFLFQDNVLLKWIQVFIFMFSTILAGKKIKIIPNLVIICVIITANLLGPLGAVLFYILNFPVTKEALLNGLEKSALITGMIYLSKTALSKELISTSLNSNPVSELFYYFEKIMEGDISLNKEQRTESGSSKRKKITGVNTGLFERLIEAADRKLFNLESYNPPKEDVSSRGKDKKTSFLSLMYLLLFTAANWLLFFV